jgi:hypothetical protein
MNGVMVGEQNNVGNEIVMRVENMPLKKPAFKVQELKNAPRLKWNPTTPFLIALPNMLPLPPIMALSLAKNK